MSSVLSEKYKALGSEAKQTLTDTQDSSTTIKQIIISSLSSQAHCQGQSHPSLCSSDLKISLLGNINKSKLDKKVKLATHLKRAITERGVIGWIVQKFMNTDKSYIKQSCPSPGPGPIKSNGNGKQPGSYRGTNRFGKFLCYLLGLLFIREWINLVIGRKRRVSGNFGSRIVDSKSQNQIKTYSDASLINLGLNQNLIESNPNDNAISDFNYVKVMRGDEVDFPHKKYEAVNDWFADLWWREHSKFKNGKFNDKVDNLNLDLIESDPDSDSEPESTSQTQTSKTLNDVKKVISDTDQVKQDDTQVENDVNKLRNLQEKSEEKLKEEEENSHKNSESPQHPVSPEEEKSIENKVYNEVYKNVIAKAAADKKSQSVITKGTNSTESATATESGAKADDNIDDSESESEEEADEDEVTISGWVYVGEITIVICLSLIFESAQDSLRESLEEQKKEVALNIMDACFSELTILGFIGLGAFMLTKTGSANDLAEYIFKSQHYVFHEGRQNPLAESFENVHMCIFCVMMVFMAQAAIIMILAEQLEDAWAEWEELSPTGHEGSLEMHLRREGYIGHHHEYEENKNIENSEDIIDSENQVEVTQQQTHSTPKLVKGEKDFDTGTFWERVWANTGVKAMMSWHGIRHLFMYPVTVGNFFDPMSQGGFDSSNERVEVKDPSSFDFKAYLTEKMGVLFTEMVEVDTPTWFFSLIIVVPFVAISTLVDAQTIMIMQFLMGLLFSIIFLIVLVDMTRIEIALSPTFCADASEFLSHMETCWRATQKKKLPPAIVGRQGKGFVMSVVGGGGQKSNYGNIPGSAGAAKQHANTLTMDADTIDFLMGRNKTVHEALFAPIHHQKMRKLLKQEAKATLQGINDLEEDDDEEDENDIEKSYDFEYLIRERLGRLPQERQSEVERKEQEKQRKAEEKRLKQELREKKKIAKEKLEKDYWDIDDDDEDEGGGNENSSEERRNKSRPWYIQLVGGDPNYQPHEHDQLFHFQERGPEIHEQIMRTMMFLQAILVATVLITTVIFQRKNILELLLLFLNLAQWPIQLFFLLPRIVNKYVVISSVENYKDWQLIQRVTLFVKERRLRDAMTLMSMAKMRGRIAQLQALSEARSNENNTQQSQKELLSGINNFDQTLKEVKDQKEGLVSNTVGADRSSQSNNGQENLVLIDPSLFDDYKELYETFPREKQLKCEETFRQFDLKREGFVDIDDMSSILQSMNIDRGSDAHQTAAALVAFVAREKRGRLNEDEFKVLLAIALEPEDEEQEIKNFDAFFELIDEDFSDSLSYQELSDAFKEMFSLPLSPSDIGELIYYTFREIKAELSKNDFVIWMRHLSDFESGSLRAAKNLVVNRRNEDEKKPKNFEDLKVERGSSSSSNREQGGSTNLDYNNNNINRPGPSTQQSQSIDQAPGNVKTGRPSTQQDLEEPDWMIGRGYDSNTDMHLIRPSMLPVKLDPVTGEKMYKDVMTERHTGSVILTTSNGNQYDKYMNLSLEKLSINENNEEIGLKSTTGLSQSNQTIMRDSSVRTNTSTLVNNSTSASTSQRVSMTLTKFTTTKSELNKIKELKSQLTRTQTQGLLQQSSSATSSRQLEGNDLQQIADRISQFEMNEEKKKKWDRRYLLNLIKKDKAKLQRQRTGFKARESLSAWEQGEHVQIGGGRINGAPINIMGGNQTETQTQSLNLNCKFNDLTRNQTESQSPNTRDSSRQTQVNTVKQSEGKKPAAPAKSVTKKKEPKVGKGGTFIGASNRSSSEMSSSSSSQSQASGPLIRLSNRQNSNSVIINNDNRESGTVTNTNRESRPSSQSGIRESHADHYGNQVIRETFTGKLHGGKPGQTVGGRVMKLFSRVW